MDYNKRQLLAQKHVVQRVDH